MVLVFYLRYSLLSEVPEEMEGEFEDENVTITADAVLNENNKYEIHASITNESENSNITLPYPPDSCELTLYFNGRTVSHEKGGDCPAVSGYGMSTGETTEIEASWGAMSFKRMNYTFQVYYEKKDSRKSVDVTLEELIPLKMPG